MLCLVFAVMSCSKPRDCKCTTIYPDGEISVENRRLGGEHSLFPEPGKNTKNYMVQKCASFESSSNKSAKTCELLK
ncbi:MAG: hypothetical protein ABI207_03875 [Crocinitomicaceae bacterium]